MRLTAAVADAPSWPTIAVSTYCRRVERISSATIGRARTMKDFRFSFLFTLSILTQHREIIVVNLSVLIEKGVEIVHKGEVFFSSLLYDELLY